MTAPSNMIATVRSNSRFIRNPGADPRVVVQVSSAESQESGEPPSVELHCGPCDKRLYDVVVGRMYKNEHARLVEDATLIVKRKCPHCRVLSRGRVTSQEGQPLERSDALTGPWRCIHCNWSLGKIDPVRSRVTTRCRCGQESRVFVVEAIMIAYL
jgi:hypothetical protein